MGKRRTEPNWLVYSAATLTVVWIFFLLWLVLHSEACPDSVSGIMDTYISCRSSNEIGDFLAGATAPLAFLWLVVTVLLQSSELKAQREELALTREELSAQRKTLESQTDLLQKEALKESIKDKTEYFDVALNSFVMKVKNNYGLFNATKISERRTTNPLHPLVKNFQTLSNEEFIFQMKKRILPFLDGTWKDSYKLHNLEYLEETHAILKRTANIARDLENSGIENEMFQEVHDLNDIIDRIIKGES